MSDVSFATNGEPPADGFDPSVAHVVGGSPNDEELAATIAVLAAVFDAGSRADRPRDLPKRRSAWDRSQRVLRGGEPLDPFADRFGRK